jgi:hypothetical protein
MVAVFQAVFQCFSVLRSNVECKVSSANGGMPTANKMQASVKFGFNHLLTASGQEVVGMMHGCFFFAKYEDANGSTINRRSLTHIMYDNSVYLVNRVLITKYMLNPLFVPVLEGFRKIWCRKIDAIHIIYELNSAICLNSRNPFSANPRCSLGRIFAQRSQHRFTNESNIYGTPRALSPACISSVPSIVSSCQRLAAT